MNSQELMVRGYSDNKVGFELGARRSHELLWSSKVKIWSPKAPCSFPWTPNEACQSLSLGSHQSPLPTPFVRKSKRGGFF